MPEQSRQHHKFAFFYDHWERSHGVLLLLFLLGLAACSPANNRDRRAANAEEPTPIPTAVVPNKPTYTVQRGAVIYAAQFSGRIAPANEAALTFARDGQVAEVYVERGDTILEGAEIARLDTQELEREWALAQSALDIAQARLTAVETSNETNRQRAELSLALAQLDLDFATNQAGAFPTAEQSYQIARLTILRDLAQVAVEELSDDVDPQLYADVQQAELRILELDTAIADAILIAPVAGVLTSFSLSPGKSVTAQAPVGTIANLDALEISANLQPSQMAELAEGMPVTIALGNRPGETFTGLIHQMPFPYGTRGSADVEPTDTSTRIRFDNPDDARQYELGDRMNMVVTIEERPDVLWLPPAAVRDFNGRHFVVVQDAQSQSRVDIMLGIEGDGRAEILEGLEEGQTIIGQ